MDNETKGSIGAQNLARDFNYLNGKIPGLSSDTISHLLCLLQEDARAGLGNQLWVTANPPGIEQGGE